MSEYGLGPRALAGGSNISVEDAPGAVYKSLWIRAGVAMRCDAEGSRFRAEASGVSGTVDAEPSDGTLSIRFPPLPDVTFICGGGPGAPSTR
jgi:hypothetical protein